MKEPKLIDLIAGARPNFIKIAPIVRAIQKAQSGGSHIRYRLVHTGQHYDKNMSQQFFDQLQIPEPDINLNAGGGTQAEQTAKIMVAYEKLLMESPCDLTLVVGDVTSTMACSIAAKKLGIRVAHVEGGIRSNDLNMPEEINRMLTDSITDYFFTTTKGAGENLLKIGIDPSNIYLVGNTMIDTLYYQKPRLTKPAFWDEFRLQKGNFLVLTLHRPSNVDEESALKDLLETIAQNCAGHCIMFPVHPRTKQILNQSNIQFANIHMVEPMGYLEFNYLVMNSKAVITDSGGITEEATVFGIPCMTLRENTERPETITEGTNVLLGTNQEKILAALKTLFAGEWKKGSIPELWDGGTADRIVKELEKIL